MAKTKTSMDVKISPSTYERLHRHMTYADSIDSAINRALDALEKPENAVSALHGGIADEAREISHRDLPSLTHTRIFYARIDDEAIDSPDWNPLLRRLVSMAVDRGMDLDESYTRHSVRVVRGRLVERGYVHVPDAGISVLNVGANAACKSIIGIAKELDLALEIRFRWHRKEGAARPGKSARLLVPESANAGMRSGRKAPAPD